MRLDKFICKSTDLTKPEAIQRIQAGDVIVNGEAITTESSQVHENNTISLNGQSLEPRPFRYILMHKPAGTICSNADGDYPSLFNSLDIDLGIEKGIEKVSELHIAGRLDVDTTGLVLITDDGRWTYNITRPDKECNKTYRVGLSYGIADNAVEALVARFKHGLQLQGEQQLTLPATLEVLPSTSNENKEGESKEVLLTITEGKYHQVKRMFAAVGNRVLTLHREKIGDIQLDVEEGKWRYLTANEIQLFTE
ncbi:MAG: pseudouridine synthase [Oleispira sp.]|nr:pseudouridine synthase [Oleispira sp.]MBL4880935.1 pseudouridine synthase [Oleispira sp.]